MTALALFPMHALAGPAGTVRVIDGDTIEVGGTRVRLHGIDAPEVAQTCETEEGITWACGDWVRGELEARIEGREATCDFHGWDRYDRVIGTCHVAGHDIGEVLVRDGLAFAYRRYSYDYVNVEKMAALEGRGLWTSILQSPEDFRHSPRS